MFYVWSVCSSEVNFNICNILIITQYLCRCNVKESAALYFGVIWLYCAQTVVAHIRNSLHVWWTQRTTPCTTHQKPSDPFIMPCIEFLLREISNFDVTDYFHSFQVGTPPSVTILTNTSLTQRSVLG